MARRFAVIGLGRLGSHLARSLAKRGAEVIAIDRDMRAVEAIKDQVTLAVRLDSVDEEALRAQGLDKVDAVIVAIGEDFESNVLTVALLKKLGVKQVIARASSEIQQQILSLVGADKVFFPEADTAERLAQLLISPSILDYIPLTDGRSVAQVNAPESFHGKTIAELKIRTRYGVNVIAVRRSGEKEITEMPSPDYVIKKGDVLVVVGANEDIEKLSKA
ncbi:TrkA family potassium uptake protein [Candidatus Poribacteria bacterium]|nr:MAG: TrkA family potassium uptake protein [Candidatus Poribacteria bacterium]